MYVIQEDMKILHALDNLHKQYEEKFGERFIAFNYADFQGVRGVAGSAAQQYKEALEKALKKDKPTRIESHRYDTIDH
jgi:hypothetical protein